MWKATTNGQKQSDEFAGHQELQNPYGQCSRRDIAAQNAVKKEKRQNGSRAMKRHGKKTKKNRIGSCDVPGQAHSGKEQNKATRTSAHGSNRDEKRARANGHRRSRPIPGNEAITDPHGEND